MGLHLLSAPFAKRTCWHWCTQVLANEVATEDALAPHLLAPPWKPQLHCEGEALRPDSACTAVHKNAHGAAGEGQGPGKAAGQGRGLQFVAGWSLLSFVMPPHRHLGLSSHVPPCSRLHYYCAKGCVCRPEACEALYQHLDDEHARAAHLLRTDTQPLPQHDKARHQQTLPHPPRSPTPDEAAAAAAAEEEEADASLAEVRAGLQEVVFLGTGAAAPYKYRTVSAIYMRLCSPHPSGVKGREHNGIGEDGILLDAGDGTYGALVSCSTRVTACLRASTPVTRVTACLRASTAARPPTLPPSLPLSLPPALSVSLARHKTYCRTGGGQGRKDGLLNRLIGLCCIRPLAPSPRHTAHDAACVAWLSCLASDRRGTMTSDGTCQMMAGAEAGSGRC